MVSFSVDVDMGATLAKLEAMKARAENFMPVFVRARAILAAGNAANFTSGGSLSGGWAPRETPAPWPIMRKSGSLMGSLASLTGPPNEINAKNATFGTDIEYAKFHQAGTFSMARRQVVFEPAGFAEEVGDMAAQHIVGSLNGLFG